MSAAQTFVIPYMVTFFRVFTVSGSPKKKRGALNLRALKLWWRPSPLWLLRRTGSTWSMGRPHPRRRPDSGFGAHVQDAVPHHSKRCSRQRQRSSLGSADALSRMIMRISQQFRSVHRCFADVLTRLYSLDDVKNHVLHQSHVSTLRTPLCAASSRRRG